MGAISVVTNVRVNKNKWKFSSYIYGKWFNKSNVMGFFQCGLFLFINATLIHLLCTEQMFRLDGYSCKVPK